jgi:putative tryptophan/tyrosine transport system substrate-binding protein
VAIIFVAADPIKAGLVESLARPGGNATGFTPGAISIAAKRVQLLKESFPSIRKMGVLLDPQYPVADELSVVRESAKTLGVEIQVGEAGSLQQYLAAVQRLRADGVDSFYVIYTGSSFAIRRELAVAVRDSRLPAIYTLVRFVDDGGLIGYSWQTLKYSRLAAEYADRIARGARPADLPVQEPTVIELAVNAATARAQGLTLPTVLMMRADRVVE